MATVSFEHLFEQSPCFCILFSSNDGRAVTILSSVKGAFAGYVEELVGCVVNAAWVLVVCRITLVWFSKHLLTLGDLDGFSAPSDTDLTSVIIVCKSSFTILAVCNIIVKGRVFLVLGVPAESEEFELRVHWQALFFSCVIREGIPTVLVILTLEAISARLIGRSLSLAC